MPLLSSLWAFEIFLASTSSALAVDLAKAAAFFSWVVALEVVWSQLWQQSGVVAFVVTFSLQDSGLIAAGSHSLNRGEH